MLTRVAIADDQRIVRAGIAAMLGSDPSLEVVALAADGPQAIATCRQLRPDLLILALRLPRLSGFGVARVLSTDPRPPRILMYSGHADAASIQAAFEAGAGGYMLTGIDTPDLLAGVHGLLAGRQVLLGLEGILEEDLHPLSAQEVVLLQEVAHGLGNKEIAALLGISVRTVGTHLSNIFDKLGVRNRTTAVDRARQQGYLAIE